MSDRESHLWVAFTPSAIVEHFERYGDERLRQFVLSADNETLLRVGEIIINDTALWDQYDSILTAAVEDVMWEQP